MDELAFEMEAGNRSVDGKDVLTSLFAIVTQRPNCPVLCADEEVEDTVLHQGDGTDTTGLQRKFRDDFQPRKGENQYVTCGRANSSRIHGTHGSTECEEDGWQVVQSRAGWSSIDGFPDDAAVVHRDQCAVVGCQTADDGSLLHMFHESLEVHLGFGHPWAEGESEMAAMVNTIAMRVVRRGQYMSSFLFSFFHLR